MKTIAKAVAASFLLTAVSMNNFVIADPTNKTLQNVKAADQAMQPVTDKNQKAKKVLTKEEQQQQVIQRQQVLQQFQLMQNIQMRSMYTTKPSILGKGFSLIPTVLNAVLNPMLSKENFISRVIAEIGADYGLQCIFNPNSIMQSVAMTGIALFADKTSFPILRACCFQMWQNALMQLLFSEKGMQIIPSWIKTGLQKVPEKCAGFIPLLVDPLSHKGEATALAYDIIAKTTGAKKVQDIDKQQVKDLASRFQMFITTGEQMRAFSMFNMILGQSVIALLGAGLSHAVSSMFKAS